MPRATPTPSPTDLATIARDLLSRPTTSYLEQHVRDYIREFADARGLEYAEDRYGNAYVAYRRAAGRGAPRRPLVLGAHMDHPGFVIDGVRGKRLDLTFRGGVSSEYGTGEVLRLYAAASGATTGRAVIEAITAANGRIAGARARLEEGVAAAGDMALWDVPAFSRRGDIIHARQCDDLGGCIAVLATLDRLAASRTAAHVIGLFTRAEEDGLRGAAVVGRERLLPEDSIVLAIETSSMAGGRAVQGGGPVVRVGDAIHVFSPRVTQWMTALAQELRAEDPTFAYQRKLMDGGVTEATAYDLYGYETGAACVALGNYHNAGPRGRIAAETIHLGDVEGLARLCVRMAETTPRFESYLPGLRKRFDRLGREAATILRASAR
ncbi:MAG: M20/M25/M40 family metallo-hydrolase [Dehalococcoidia bacterium]|nr:M20/M25/M40 family metallo-hydrolase [Dehalococcoidia bacterium]